MAVLMLTTTPAVFAGEIPPDHPILGTWQYTVSESCFETYEFRPDGIDHTISRDEIGDDRYEVSTAPDDRGFYKLTDIVMTSNGKKDCNGQTSPIGDVTSGYAMFGSILAENASLLRTIAESVHGASGPHK